MKKTIWKYPIEITDRQQIGMPTDSKILCVQVQQGQPCLWVLVNPSSPKIPRLIEVFGTGHPISYDMGVDREYIGTFQVHGGSLVFHVFGYTGV